MHFGNVVGYCTDGEDDYDTKEMVNFIARPLEMGELNYDHKVNKRAARKSEDGPLTRIRGGERATIT